MRVVRDLFESKLNDGKKYDPTNSEWYLLTDERDVVEKNLVLHLKDKESDLYKFVMNALPYSSWEYSDLEKSKFTVFENVDEFCDYVRVN